jgi:hypothetical protein
VYPVKGLAKAKALDGELVGVEPYADEPYYAGFRVGGQECGMVLPPRLAMWRTKEGEPVTWGASAAARTGGARWCRSE